MIDRFDLGALFRDVDRARRSQGLSWAALARRVGVSASTIRRFDLAEDAEADGVLALVRWLGVTPEDYVAVMTEGQQLPDGDVGVVRVDMDLVARAEGRAGGADGRSRTTIQRLVAAARSSGCPVASLTRLSEV
ncbi:MAG: helix-turn-helix transcriptional regulator [Actinomycetota bacterium]